MAEQRQSEIDRAVQFGELIGSVKALKQSVDELTVDVIDLKKQLNTGRGMAMGIMAAVSVAGGAVGAFAHKLLEVIK